MLYDWLKNQLFDPLGYKIFRSFSFPQVIYEALTLSNKNAMIHKETPIPTN